MLKIYYGLIVFTLGISMFVIGCVLVIHGLNTRTLSKQGIYKKNAIGLYKRVSYEDVRVEDSILVAPGTVIILHTNFEDLKDDYDN